MRIVLAPDSFKESMSSPAAARAMRRGIEQGVYPFGLCIKTDGSAVYQIFKRLLDEWIAERAVDEVP